MGESRELNPDECLRLLTGGIVGRVAIATPTGPHILPVNYSVVDGALIFRTTPYSLLGTYGRNAQLAFEVDHFDYENQRGWSVVARGRADAVTDPEEIQHIRNTWPPRPWADGTRNLYVKLPWTELSGRRIGNGWTTTNEAPIRRAVGAY